MFHIQNTCAYWDSFGNQDMENSIVNLTFTCTHIENRDREDRENVHIDDFSAFTIIAKRHTAESDSGEC